MSQNYLIMEVCGKFLGVHGMLLGLTGTVDYEVLYMSLVSNCKFWRKKSQDNQSEQNTPAPHLKCLNQGSEYLNELDFLFLFANVNC